MNQEYKEEKIEKNSQLLDQSIYEFDTYSEPETSGIFTVKKLKYAVFIFLLLAVLVAWYWAAMSNNDLAKSKTNFNALARQVDIIESEFASQLRKADKSRFGEQIQYFDKLVRSNNVALSDKRVKNYRDELTKFSNAFSILDEQQSKIEELKNFTNVSISEVSELLTLYVTNEGLNEEMGSIKPLVLAHQYLTKLEISYADYADVNLQIDDVVNYQDGLIKSVQDLDLKSINLSQSQLAVLLSDLNTGLTSLESGFSKFALQTNEIESVRKNIEQANQYAAEFKRSLNKGNLLSSKKALTEHWEFWVSLIMLVFGLLLLWVVLLKLRPEKTPEVLGLQEVLSDQQKSIISLLDNMSSLADGDLTIEAEVTDQVTGAFADSINFAVVEMRELVSKIKQASVEVASSVEDAVTNTKLVSSTNHKQAEEISAVAKQMSRVQRAMRDMSQQANSSSGIAMMSNEAALKGNQAVSDTIKGMEAIRLQIQDTSKRIKRLGESSQRIGDIVALISDVADQTNILALNAAIQASSADEPNRGFATVSDEVQVLAERATVASTKIVELVSVIQNDTNDAINSMEKATQQVISGAKLADSAGMALAEIESSSKDVYREIDAISRESDSQADVVHRVAEQVTQASQLSQEASQESQKSANAIAKLMELAQDLESSITRFKLPE